MKKKSLAVFSLLSIFSFCLLHGVWAEDKTALPEAKLAKSKAVIKKRLARLPHTDYGKEYYADTPENLRIIYGHQSVSVLDEKEAQDVLYFLDLLGQKKIICELALQLELDLDDIHAEHGGIILPEDENPFRVYASAFNHSPGPTGFLVAKGIVNVFDDNSVYILPDEALLQPHLAWYHFHACQEDSTAAAGPSWYLARNEIFGDIGDSIFQLEQRGDDQLPSLVITKLKGRKFNVGYYSVRRMKEGVFQTVILDLGNYRY